MVLACWNYLPEDPGYKRFPVPSFRTYHFTSSTRTLSLLFHHPDKISFNNCNIENDLSRENKINLICIRGEIHGSSLNCGKQILCAKYLALITLVSSRLSWFWHRCHSRFAHGHKVLNVSSFQAQPVDYFIFQPFHIEKNPRQQDLRARKGGGSG